MPSIERGREKTTCTHKCVSINRREEKKKKTRQQRPKNKWPQKFLRQNLIKYTKDRRETKNTTETSEPHRMETTSNNDRDRKSKK